MNLKLKIFFLIAGLFWGSANLQANTLGWDAKTSINAGFPPTLFAEAWVGNYWMVKPIQIPRDKVILRQIDRYVYTYVRPHIRLLTSGVISRVSARVDFFPLSFLGGTVGTSYSSGAVPDARTFEKWTGINCELWDCALQSQAYFLETKFRYAFTNYFGVIALRKDFVSSRSGQDRVYDLESGLVAENNSYGFSYWGIFGRSFDDYNLAFRYKNVDWAGTGGGYSSGSLIYSTDLGSRSRIAVESGIRNLKVNFFCAVKLEYVFREGPSPE